MANGSEVDTMQNIALKEQRRDLASLSDRIAKVEQQVAELFDLTSAEARVAAAIAEGSDLKSLADRLSLSVETVRGQLKSVFRKTGTRRQNELAARILLSPALRPREAPPIKL